MSLYKRRSLLALPLALAACGFSPVYGTDGTGTKLRAQVLVEEPSTQEGYLLTRNMETRLGRSGSNARYILSYTITTKEDGLAISESDETTRYNIIGKVAYSLQDTTTGTVVTSGNVENFTAYSATGTTVATLAAEQDALERLMVILADQITTRLYAVDLPA